MTNVCDGLRKEDCLQRCAVIESPISNVFQIGRQSDEYQGITTIESTPFNPCDGVGYCDPLQGFTMKESHVLDDSTGRMKDEFYLLMRLVSEVRFTISKVGEIQRSVIKCTYDI